MKLLVLLLCPLTCSIENDRLADIPRFAKPNVELHSFSVLPNVHWDSCCWFPSPETQVAASQDTTVPLLPVIGNGDILSWRDHEERLEQAMREFDEGEAVGHRRWSTCCMLARYEFCVV